MFANRDAVMYFLEEIWPLIVAKRARRPVLSPSARIRRASCRRWPRADPRIVGHGIRRRHPAARAQAAVYVVPLRVGGGTRLKVLDAMAIGKAMVSTSIGCEGIDVRGGRAPARCRHAGGVRARHASSCCGSPERRAPRRGRARARRARVRVARRRRAAARRLSRRPSARQGARHEPIRGGTLSHRARLGPEPPAHGLRHAARAGALRRPLSPSSVTLLARTEWLLADELEAYQDERLRAIVAHAYETVPFYRRRFDELQADAGGHPRTRRPAEAPAADTRRHPAHFDDLRSRRCRRARRCRPATPAARPARR